MVRVKYLTNKEILAEIHRSKSSFCYWIDPKYNQYDAIVSDLSVIDGTMIEQIKQQKALQIYQAVRNDLKEQGLKNHQIKVAPVDPESIKVEDLVWRLMTWDHIPSDPSRVKNPQTEAQRHTKILFSPFKHFILKDGEFIEVGRSHWKGDFETGKFFQEHGRITNKLGTMFLKLVERYSQRYNWRGYTYVDEMRSQALLQLSAVGLQFDESRSDNPFAYYTVTVQNAFTRVLNLEKRNQDIRDDILIMHGAAPSMTRQLANEMEQRNPTEDPVDAVEDGDVETPTPATKPAKRGFPKKAAKTTTSMKPSVMAGSDLWETGSKAAARTITKKV